MPSDFYMTEVKQILSCASEDIPKSDEIRTIVKDIWDIRMAKLRSSADLLVRNHGNYAAVDNLTLMEINSIRPLLPHTLDQIYRMKNVSCKIYEVCEVMFYFSVATELQITISKHVFHFALKNYNFFPIMMYISFY